MSGYQFSCHNRQKLFSRILSLVDRDEREVLCLHCGSKNIEQCWSSFNAITAKKSAGQSPAMAAGVEWDSGTVVDLVEAIA